MVTSSVIVFPVSTRAYPVCVRTTSNHYSLSSSTKCGSPILLSTLILFLCSAFTLPVLLRFILIAQFLNQVSITFFLTFLLTILLCWLSRVVRVNLWPLSNNSWEKCSHWSNGPLKQLRSCNMLWLRQLWRSHGVYTLLPLSSCFLGTLSHWQKPALWYISRMLTSVSSCWSSGYSSTLIEIDCTLNMMCGYTWTEHTDVS